MALTLAHNGDYIEPVYGTVEWKLTETAPCNYFTLTITPTGFDAKVLKLIPDASMEATVNIQSILQNCIVSDVSSAAAQTLLIYTIAATSDIGGSDSDSGAVYAGSKTLGYDLDILLMNDGSYNKFLNTQKATTVIYDASCTPTVTLETFTGTGALESGTLNWVAYKGYGEGIAIDSSSVALSYGAGLTISKIDISPVTLGIPMDADFYEVHIGTVSETIKINIKPMDNRYDKYWHVSWTDINGATCTYDFDKAYINTVNINRNIYNSSGSYKPFNTVVKDRYTISSGLMTEAESLGLKDLFYSPSVTVSTPPVDNTAYPIIIDVNSVDIVRRRNTHLIQYTFTFEYANEYVVPQE